jgi:hypothetical protein
MKKLSLQWRITLMTALLICSTCMAMNWLIGCSGRHYMDSIGANLSTVYTAPINADGTLGVWTTGTSLPAAVSHSQAIVTKNRVYLLGGSVNGSTSSTVHTAPINADGTLGTWTTGTSLPAAVYDSQAIVTKNRVYLLGGRDVNNNPTNVVYTAPINADGTLGDDGLGGVDLSG